MNVIELMNVIETVGDLFQNKPGFSRIVGHELVAGYVVFQIKFAELHVEIIE